MGASKMEFRLQMLLTPTELQTVLSNIQRQHCVNSCQLNSWDRCNFFFNASSDLSVLDFDIPMASSTELLTIIGIMAFVTWQVLFVGVLATVSSTYVQRGSLANYIVSMERIKQYMHIPAQPPVIVADRRTPTSWPPNARIELLDLKALEKCQLKSTTSKMPNLLDSFVSDEGENWSMGQRQLFCLGRFLLRRNKILVLDEETASIDSTSDAILQKIIRQEFANCTVITVAHRVPTVMDNDMVMVLSYGKLVEYDELSKLMETNSSFSKLVSEYWSSCKRN